MPIIDFSKVSYNPILCVRPAEMTALQELPERDKDLLFPHILLRPWLGSHHLENTLARIEIAYGDRPLGVEITAIEDDYAGARRPVHDEIDALRDSAGGYAAWIDFIERKPNFVPVLQISDLAQLVNQTQLLRRLDRGIILRLPEDAISRAEALIQSLAVSVDPNQFLVMFDFQRWTKQMQARQGSCAYLVDRVKNILPGCFVSVSSSSFPDSFVANTGQEIYERNFFNGVVQARGGDGVIYSDRGSARVERQTGGGGAPAPRIDLALADEWQFFREEGEEDRADLYERAANRAVDSDGWDSNLRVWGTQLIEQTALGIPGGIATPLKSTSVRINIHLHRQLFYGSDPSALYDTDEDWSD